MNKIYSLLIFLCCIGSSYSQSDNCLSAVTLTVSAGCTPVSGSTAGFTQSISGCAGNADDDGWYKFTATATSHSISVAGSASFDAVLEVFSGTCGALVSIACIDNTFNGQTESVNINGLTSGTIYYVRVYHYSAGSGSSTFNICLTNPPAPPSNDACVNAINLAVNSSCSNTSGTTVGATQSIAGCAGTADDDVWYKFTANSYTQTITMTGSAGIDGVVELFSGTCGALSSIACMDNTFSGGVETINAVGLNPGQVYYLRVYDYYSGGGYTFSVCVVGNPIGGGQPNDNPCSAIQLPTVTSDCNYLTFSTNGATNTGAGLAPTPFSCVGGSGGSGGFAAGSLDVWFKITVPASGAVYVTPLPNQGAGYITDGSMALYSGSCGSLSQIACSSDYTLYPGSANDLLPYIAATGQTPGATLYLRYWAFGTSSGNFGICVQSPTNDDCANALYVCDINGYSGSTSAAYTPDRPGTGAGQMFANNETAAGVNQPDGTNTCGPFGYYPACPATTAGPYSSPLIDVNIENNSWIKFTASSTIADLRVTVGNCWVGNYPTGGIQMQIFSSTGCNNFVPVSSFKEGSSTFTVSATGLTVGNNYYLMVDGYAKDICNYTIQALNGVAFPAIVATPTAVCPGQSAILTAPSGATSYEWFPSGETTQSITVNPGSTQTFTCIAGGICGYKQTLTKQVVVKSVPTVSINAGAAIVNCGTQTITLTGGGASTYTWSTSSTASSFTVAPTGSQSYSVIGTAANGCTNTAITNVTVNTVPTVSVASSSNTICNGANTSLTVSGANTYTWSPAASLSAATGTAVTASPTVGTNYTIIGTAANGCTNSATYSVTVNPKPTVSSTTTNSVICNNGSTTLSGTGASSYSWSGGVTDGVAFTPTSTATYTVIGTNAVTGCTNQAVRPITVNTPPTVSSTTSNSVICLNASTTLSGTGASTYTWTGGVTNGVSFTPTATATYTVIGTAASGCTNIAVRTITVNPKPTVGSTVSSPTLCNGSSTILSGTGASSYIWTGGVSNGVAFNPPLGTSNYTVTGTDATTGCTNTAVTTITVNSIPTSAASTTGSITCVTNTINLNSSLSGQSYTWTAPGSSSISGGTANNQNAIGQGQGTYTLTVLSPAGCTYTTTLTANINTTTPVASATNGTLTCAATSTVLAGSPGSGVTYSWSGTGITGSATSATVTVTAVGNYSLITTNTLTGCSNTTAAIATVTNNLTTPTVTAGSNQVITCAVPSVTLTGSATGGSNLNWSNGATTNTTTVGGAGNYTLTATNPGTGCFATSTVSVSPSAGTPNGTVGSVTNSITCSNTSVAVSITSTVSPLNYSWTGPGTIASPTSSATSVSSGGTYTITITNTASCSQSYAVFVPTNTTPVVASASITSSSSSITCNNSSVTLGATPTGTNYVYAWTGPNIILGAATANPVVGAGGNYTVTITNTITGCSGVTGTTNVAVPTSTVAPTLNLSATSLTTTCGAPSTTVGVTSNSNPNTTYTWTAPGTGTIDNVNISTPLLGGSGVFTVAVTNTVNGCISAAATVTITPDVNTPTFNLTSNSATITCSVPSPSVSLTSTVSGVTYSWSPTPSSGITTASPTFTATGNYTCLITNQANGCSTNAAQVDVTDNTIVPTISITPGVSVTCASTLVTVSSTANTAVTYTWTGTGIQGSSNNSSISANAAGVYSLVVTDPSNGCISSASTSIGTNTTAPTLTVSATSSVLTCSTTTSTLTATPSTTDTPTWIIPSGSSATNPVTASTTGDYVATLIDASNGCSVSQTITIANEVSPPNANAGAAVVMPCNISVTTLLGTSTATDAVSYSWSGPNAGSVISGTNSATPTVTDTGVYTLTVTNLVTGCTATSTVDVSTDNVSADFTADPMIGEIPLNVNFTNTSIGANNYSWTFGNGLTSGSTNPNTVYNNVGTYTVMLVASSNSCSDTMTKIIIAEDGFTIEIPNVFTPNGDGANDIFHIKTTGVKSAEGFIYNRWGQLLFSWDALNNSWDGKAANGENCPDATYYYLIKVIDKKDKEHIAPGYVLIVR
ncbi:MAG: gliding motility-associated C-terminal domain-containing protein [Burkholderiales bacterium]|nr:gliding motility-associated C-terminal domain-containing protein [Bacteroidia bacterium]